MSAPRICPPGSISCMLDGSSSGFLTSIGRCSGWLRRPNGVLIVEEPDFVTIFGAAEPPALRRVITAGMRHLESTCPVNVEYGRRLLDDLTAVGLVNVTAEGRCALVRGGTPPTEHFLRLTLEKLRSALLADQSVSESEFAEAVEALEDPSVTVMMPMTIAAWGWRP